MNRKRVKIKRSIFFLMLAVVISFSSYGQNTNTDVNATVQIDTIPELSAFMKLSLGERIMDKGIKKYNKRYLHFKYNRSRYNLEHYKNDEKITGFSNAEERFGNVLFGECKCILRDDEVSIEMEKIYKDPLSGIGFRIEVQVEEISSRFYLIRIGNQNGFKSTSEKELDRHYVIPMEEQQLILNNPSPYKKGQQLTGYFKFKSENYEKPIYIYMIEEEDDSDKKDTHYLKGVIHFTCKLQSVVD